uniref:uncharacterized protein LOC124045501 n=1 Tax=Oncorhynchus gorbuscha TaxID=8017 RepID=UPI001EAF7E0F|nr:uncharacterized protein LOC124045501 [Oncorhynchus gorbuscha]
MVQVKAPPPASLHAAPPNSMGTRAGVLGDGTDRAPSGHPQMTSRLSNRMDRSTSWSKVMVAFLQFNSRRTSSPRLRGLFREATLAADLGLGTRHGSQWTGDSGSTGRTGDSGSAGVKGYSGVAGVTGGSGRSWLTDGSGSPWLTEGSGQTGSSGSSGQTGESVSLHEILPTRMTLLPWPRSRSSLAAENWKERQPKEELSLGVTSEIYLLERVLWVGAAMVTSELREGRALPFHDQYRNRMNIGINLEMWKTDA